MSGHHKAIEQLIVVGPERYTKCFHLIVPVSLGARTRDGRADGRLFSAHLMANAIELVAREWHARRWLGRLETTPDATRFAAFACRHETARLSARGFPSSYLPVITSRAKRGLQRVLLHRSRRERERYVRQRFG